MLPEKLSIIDLKRSLFTFSGLKDLPDPHPDCQVCHQSATSVLPKDQNSFPINLSSSSRNKELDATTTDSDRCPVCGIPTRCNLDDIYLGTSLRKKRRRASSGTTNASFDMPPELESFDPDAYEDPIARLLLSEWKDEDDTKDQVCIKYCILCL